MEIRRNKGWGGVIRKMQGYLLGGADHPKMGVSEPFQGGMGIRSPKL